MPIAIYSDVRAWAFARKPAQAGREKPGLAGPLSTANEGPRLRLEILEAAGRAA